MTHFSIPAGGRFRICQLTDIHLDSTERFEEYEQTFALIRQTLRDTSPALGEGHRELAFFHVPVPEYIEVWDYEPCKGFNQERVCATDCNDGLFAAMVRGGAMRGVFVGHDHINDYEGTLHGIRLCYGRGSGYQCYGLEGYAKGARIIDIGGGADFESAIYLETGEIYEQKRTRRPKLNRK